MPGHAGGAYWAAVDFDSEGEEPSARHNQRIYLDPWDTEAYGLSKDPPDSSQGENMNSFVGEPISASFYYVPTKNYESEDEMSIPMSPAHVVPPDYPMYGGRKKSRLSVHDFHPEIEVYECEIPIRDRRRSYIEEPAYAPRSLIYEPIYGYVPPPPMMCQPRPRVSVHHHPDYVLPIGKSRRHSRMAEAYEHYSYDSLSPDYEDWARPFPKTAPENFHLSRYGHLQIDYTYNWNSLDRLIRNS
ncbi:hypothetical protein EVAR_56847_1 [Eumeta japonica]|uniref:Uncharacterized protein n=1 Tax=Eumeta variegata TaxID=151549 RepID=A0A4C1ZBU7_EUMVA|nr:hypothetical protein EVAR_56847_1 [Eumeta japonica]